MKNRKFLILFVLGFFCLYGSGTVLAQTDFWEQTNGPEGGDVLAIAADSGGRLFAGTHGGLFRSSDEGQTWEKIGLSEFGSNSVKAIAINSSDEIFVFAWAWLGIFKSSDHGDTWVAKNNGFDHHDVRSIAFHPNNEDYIFLGTYDGGIYRSTDNGESWEHVFQPPGPGTYIYAFSIAISHLTNDVYVACGLWSVLGLYRSQDWGDSWSRVEALPEANFGSAAVSPITGHIFAAVGGGDPAQGIYRSIDNGENWDFVPISTFCWAVQSWKFDSSGNIYIGTYQNSGVYKSVDDGLHWTHVGLYRSVQSLEINSEGDIFAGTQGQGVYHSTLLDLPNWSQINNGLISQDVRSIAVDSSGVIFAGTAMNNMFRSMDNGQSWSWIDLDISYLVGVFDIAINSQDHIFACGQNFSRSTDNGASWTNDPWFELGFWPYSIAISNSDKIYVGSMYTGVWTSTDNGLSWNHLGLEGMINGIAINSSNHIFVATYSDGIHRSTDEGATWERIGEADISCNLITSIAVNSEGVIFAGTHCEGGIYRSMDNGETWTRLANFGVDCIAINQEDHIFIGVNNGGVWRSIDDGETWIEVNDGLTNFFIRDMAFDSSGFIYVGTWACGVFKSVETTLSDPIILIQELIGLIESMNLKKGIDNSLDAKLENAKKSLESLNEGNRQDAINKLHAFINECEAQRGKALTNDQADLLISKAQVIITLLQNGA